MTKTNILIVFLAFASITGGLFAQKHFNTDKAVSGSLNNGSELIEFSLPDLEGKQHRISEWQDKIRIINFWATWCPPCLKEIPEFIKIQNEFADKGIQFIGIALDDKKSVKEYLSAHPVNYPILLDDGQATFLSRQLGNVFNAVPFTLIVNRQKQIIYQQPGEINREKILAIIKPLLQSEQ